MEENAGTLSVESPLSPSISSVLSGARDNLSGSPWSKEAKVKTERSQPSPPSKLKLRLALGMGCFSGSCLAVNPSSGTLAYPASGVTVLLDIVNSKQRGYIHQAHQTISCVKFSPDGNLLLIGELGYMPPLRVWSIQQEVELTKFLGHEYGIVSASFSKDMHLVVSVGTRHDGFINVWGWPNKNKLACNRFAEDIFSMAFSTKDNFFTTCGTHHIKFWYPVPMKKEPNKYCPLRPSLSTLYGRPAILGDIKNFTFVDIVCGSQLSEDFIYSVTKCGIVCKLSTTREVKVYKRLQNTQLSSIQVHDTQLMVGSICGHVYFFDALSLEFKVTVALPLDICFAEQVIKSQTSTLEAIVDQHKANIYLALDYEHNLLTAALTNGSLCIWDISDLNNIKQKYYSVNHSKAISGLDLMRSSTASKNKETIVTVSHDATVRIWEIAMSNGICCKSSKTIYTEFDRTDPSVNEVTPVPQESMKLPTNEKLITTVKISPDRDYIVTGDSTGLISVYQTSTLENIKTVHRHNRGVSTLHIYCGSRLNLKLLISGGRDRMIHIFDMNNNFILLSSLNVHSSSINSLGMCCANDTMTLFSSGLDRSLIMSRSRLEEVPKFKPFRCRHTACSVIDMIVCANECLIGVGRINGEVSMLDARSCKEIKRLNVCSNENARLEKIQIDTMTNLILSACSDRTISVFSLANGMLLADVHGHAKSVSGLCFSHNLKFVISTSKDGCVFIWGLPTKVLKIGAKISNMGEIPWANQRVRESSSESKLNEKNSSIQLPDLEISQFHSPLAYITSAKKHMQRIVTVDNEKSLLTATEVEEEEEEEVNEVFVEEFSLMEDSCWERIEEQHRKGMTGNRRVKKISCTSDTRLIKANQSDVKFSCHSTHSGDNEYPASSDVMQKQLSAPVTSEMLHQQTFEAGDRDQDVKSMILPGAETAASPPSDKCPEDCFETTEPSEDDVTIKAEGVEQTIQS
ncbi:mitogen-activated protein kinase-binding protein 1-like isoform X1 [Biomphalaria glabrata]|uniref:Mitogen-activated protein kinase-binding protein 1-like isoform X1 n=2 Tax=Biomphalaria glabrata TaxID=6526 RepID=A0A9W2YZX2_BIOGL|nr:mitogen-activated protein kinase-binding protein 1-like isoform X1 [Biomphalaria glabrata]XP_055868260.1 mitogen-activated protein kinase-binding protein 1-like isoform X1 [Biomphalaria glabrata]